MHITIKLHLIDNTYTKWDTVLNPVNNILYAALPNVFPPAMSKQTIMSLLGFAEDKLDVDAVVFCLRKDHPDRKFLLESFLFMGMEPLSRKSLKAPPSADKDTEHFFLIYNIDDGVNKTANDDPDDDDDDDDDDDGKGQHVREERVYLEGIHEIDDE